MKANTRTIGVEELLRHTESLRGMIQALVGDAASADDVVQETRLVALRGEAPVRDPERFLRGVARRLAARSQRSALRRRRREAQAARPEQLSSASKERTAILRSVLVELDGLDETTRRALCRRYLDGVPPREIAREEQAPLTTIKSRLRRGLEELRRRLDRRHGSRASWCLVLGMGSARGALFTASIFGGVAMKFALGAAVIAAGVLLYYLPGSKGEALPRAEQPSVSVTEVEAPKPEAPETTPPEPAPIVATPFEEEEKPKPRSSPRAIQGEFLVRDAKGTVHRELNGRLRYRRGKVEGELEIKAGRFSLPAGKGRVDLLHCEASGRPVWPDIERIDDKKAVVEGRWVCPLKLRVVSAAGGGELSQVSVRSSPQWESTPSGDLIVDRADSPFELPPDIRCRSATYATYWISAPGHAWKRITVDHHTRGERQVALTPSGTVEVGVRGVAGRDLELWLRREPDRAEERVRAWVDRDRRVRFDPVAMGRWILTIEEEKAQENLGPIENEILLKRSFELEAGGQQSFDLQLEAPVARQERVEVPIGGLLCVPTGWDLSKIVLYASGPEAKSRDVAYRKIPLASMTKEKEGHRWKVEGGAAGSWNFRVAPMDFRIAQPVPATGNEGLRLEVPPPCVLKLNVVDARSGFRLEKARVDYMPAPQGESSGMMDYLPAHRVGDHIVIRAPKGKVDLFVEAPGHASAHESIELRDEEQTRTITLKTSTGLRFEVREKERLLPYDPSWKLELSGLDGGKVRSWSMTAFTVTKPGRYRLSMRTPEGFRTVEPIDLTLEEGRMKEIVIELIPDR